MSYGLPPLHPPTLVCCGAFTEAFVRCSIWHTRTVALERQGVHGPTYRTARLCSVHRKSVQRIGVMLAPTTVRWRLDERAKT